MKCIKVKLKEAEIVKNKLIMQKILDLDYKPIKEKEYIYYPVKEKLEDYTLIEKELEKKTPRDLKESLKIKLTKQELEKLNRSYDVIGNIAILELEDELLPKKEIIAEQILKLNKNIKTVVRKIGGHEGEYRVQQYEFIRGINNLETIHTESAIKIKLDISKVYFTPRWASERLRIAKQVKENEKVLVMFSGVGVYCLIISKHTKAKEIYCVELNPIGARYCEENIKLNKLKDVYSYEGDVKEIVPTLGKFTFDRIIMPLPKDSLNYLGIALNAIKKNGIVHLYLFSTEEEINSKLEELKKKCKCKIFNVLKTGQQSPRIYRYCVEFRVF